MDEPLEHRHPLPPRPRSRNRLLWALTLLVFGSGCSYLNTQTILKEMNSSAACPPPPRSSAEERVARIVFASVTDSYFDQKAVGTWLDAAIVNPEPIMTLYAWTAAHPHPSSTGGCPMGAPASGICSRSGFEDFRQALLPQTLRQGGTIATKPSVWNLPAPAVCLQRPASAGEGGVELPEGACAGERPSNEPFENWRISLTATPEAVPTMIDEERFVANLASIPSSLVALRNIVDPSVADDEVRRGVVRGLAHAKRYITQRRWGRTPDRARAALVLSGGAGTGAFEAGFVNRLLSVLQVCEGRSDKCGGANVDLVVGTSTGSLVGVLVDMFATHDANLQGKARKLLRDEYTCSVEQDLYCQVDASIARIAADVPGLVKFDGIEHLLQDNLTAPLTSNATELVTMTVDYESGDLFAESDQDPDDATTPEGRVQSVLASIVEPLMAYPVNEIRRANGTTVKGTFIDGGIRSGLPVLEAMRRGAERVVAISTSSIDPDPIHRPPDAVSVVLRTIDLLVDQPRTSEVQQADLAAIARRMSEYNLCKWRYDAKALKGTSLIPDDREIEQFCRRNLPLGVGRVQGAAAGWLTPGTLEQVSSSWQASWVFRPEKQIPGMAGYTFDPVGMRKLYMQGIDTFQDRCQEVLDLFAIPADVVRSECSKSKAVAEEEERRQLLDEAKCEARTKLPRRTCPSP